MLANQRNELVGCDQKCDCVDKPQQAQDDKSRQPVGISQREKTLKCILVIHLSAGQQTSNVEHPITLAIGNRKSKIKRLPGGESNSRPTPKSFGAALRLQMIDRDPRIFICL